MSNEARLTNEEEIDNQNRIPENWENEDGSKHFGDYQGVVQEGHVRLLFANIQGIPSTEDHPKNLIIREAITKTGASIIGLAETNVSWKKLRGKNRWEERSFGWWEDMRSITSHNVCETPKKFYQPGGNMMITKGKIKFRILESGTDPSNMGRWCWQLFSGKRGVATRVITAYRPCKSNGLHSTYIQQRRILDAKKNDSCPRNKFMEDLAEAITGWLTKGDQIVLMLDLNDDILNSLANEKLKSIGLTECITQRHDDLQTMATCNRGTKAIDGIYVSNTIMIQKGGYSAFNTFPSDHRALWVDITMSNICGSTMAQVLHPQARRLKCNDPVTQQRWTNLYIKALNEKDAVQRVYTLQEKLVQPLTEDLAKEYEKLRHIRTDACKFADKKCRKFRMGGIPYSVELAMARKRIELWKSIISWKLGRRINMKYIKRLEKKVGIYGGRHTSLVEAKLTLAKTFTDYWDIKRQADELRITFLQKKAKELAKDKSLDDKNVYLQLISREKQRKSARKIKYVLNKVLGGGVTKISLLNHHGQWEEITDKEKIEQGCAIENASKYRQTESTPCMQGQLATDLGYLGDTASAQQILEGTYTPPAGTDQYTTEYLQHLQYDPKAHINPPVATLPTNEYIKGWKKKKEFTSAGKTGWTFSHSKTCALNQNTADFEAAMAHIPYITGYTPKEWQVGVDIMIYKKANMDRVDKLRTIVLKEADANFNDGRLGRDMMDHAERHKMIAREQYGSRKGHSSIDHAINKRLSYDMMRLYRSPGALCSNDAKSCYDRILHSIVALSMRRLGIPEPPIECMLKCIQKMDHFIRTNHGDSETSYSSKNSFIPFQGVLQGNGASPAIWVAVSTPLLNMMRHANHGMQLTSAISNQSSTIVAFAFVDDTDLIQGNMGDVEITVNEVMQDMQQAIYRWEGGLKATGGALVPEKSYVYPIDFKFDNMGKAKYRTIQEIGAHFEVPDAKGNMMELRQFEASEASETLGVLLSPDGNDTAAKEALIRKATLWSELIHKGHLKATDVMLAMDTTIVPALQYPLTALTLNEKECTSIMAPILDVALPHSQICRTFPRAVVYGPKALMGLGKTDLYVRQGAMQIGILQQYLHTETMTGELLRSNIEIIKIHIGIGSNLFQLDYDRLQRLVPSSLIKHIWHFSNKYNISIQEEVTSDILLRRGNDKYLMEEIAKYDNQFTNNDLTHINRCRIYLKVATLADVSNGNGTMIRQGVMKGEMMMHNRDYYKWPRQSRPGIASWRLWRKALKECFMRNVRLHLSPGLHLGRWNDGRSEGWNWFFMRQTQKVFQRLPNRWRVYRRQGRGRIGAQSPFVYMSDALSKPIQALRCTVFEDSLGRIRLQGSGREGEIFIRQQNTQQTILTNNTVHGDVNNIIDSIQNGTAKPVSDGSFVDEEGIGTAGWIIEGSIEGNQLRGQHEAPGAKESQCSHRSEMWGMLGIIMTVNEFCERHNIMQGTITAKCDGEGTINILRQLYPITKNSRKHFDIILALHEAIKSSPIQWTFEHLKGHQDKYISYSQLDRWAQLNVLADTMAKQEVTRILQEEGRQGSKLPVPYNQCRIFWKTRGETKEPISSHLGATLMDLIQKEKLKRYWEKKKKLGPETSAIVDWEALCKSAKSYKRGKWLSKYVTGICGVGVMLQLWKHQAHNSCPRCGVEKEDVEHVVTCKNPDATITWNESVANLETWMHDNDAEPNMAQIICSSLRSWRTGERLPYPNINLPLIVVEAMVEQDRIGWNNFINGFISTKWRVIQKAYLKDLGSMKSPDLWISRFQKRIWWIPWQLWQHRNEFLHNDGKTIHFQETAAVNREIRREYLMTGQGLPRPYQHLFQGNVNDLINQSIFTKQEWLKSVWTARDHHMPAQVRPRDSIAEASYLRWKKIFEK